MKFPRNFINKQQLSIAVEPANRHLSVEWENKENFVFCSEIDNCIEEEVVSVFALIKPENIDSLKTLTLVRHFANFTRKHEIPVKIVPGTDIHKIAITHLAEYLISFISC